MLPHLALTECRATVAELLVAVLLRDDSPARLATSALRDRIFASLAWVPCGEGVTGSMQAHALPILIDVPLLMNTLEIQIRV